MALAEHIDHQTKGRPSRGMNRRLAIALVAAAVIPTTVLGGLSAWSVRHQAAHESTVGSTSLVRVIGFGLDSILQDARRVLEVTAANPAIADGQWQGSEAGSGRTLASIVHRYPLFTELYLLDTSGVPTLASGGKPPGDAIAGFRPELADNYGGYVSDVFRAGPEEAPHIFMVVEIRASDLRKRGFIAAELDLSRLHSELERTASPDKEGWRLFIVDSKGRAIYPSSEWGTASLRPTHPAVDRVLSSLSEGHVTYEDGAGVAWFATYESMVAHNPFRGVPWGIVVERPVDRMFASANDTARNTVVVALACLLIALISSGVVSRRLTRPLSRLTTTASAIGVRGVRDAPGPDAALLGRADEIGELARALGSMLNDLQRNRVELERRHDALRKAERLSGVGILAAGIAHEINNPLTTIFGYGEFLLEDKRPDHDDYEALELIVSESDRVREIVRGLLDLSRRSGDHTSVDLRFTCLRAVKLSRAGLEMDNVEIDVMVTPDDADCRVTGDPQGVLQLTMNLISNAVDALCETEGATIDVRIEVDDTATVSVADNGPGMPDAVRAQIFEPFFTTKPAGQGTGLGLAVVTSIARDHDAVVEVDSAPGQGTTFRVKFARET